VRASGSRAAENMAPIRAADESEGYTIIILWTASCADDYATTTPKR